MNSENIGPENAFVGPRVYNVNLRSAALKTAEAATQKPGNQEKTRRPLGALSTNSVANVAREKVAGKKNGAEAARGLAETMECETIALKKEPMKVEPENMDCLVPLISKLPADLKEEELSDESMEVENLVGEIVAPLASFAAKETEYHVDYRQYLLYLETQKMFRINHRYMSRQREIDFDMRATLIDWLVLLREEFKMNAETLFLAVGLIDRFLSIMSCSRDKLQLAGVTAMFIAAKYEEVYPPPALELVDLTSNTYTVRQLLKLEVSMIKVLKYQIATPTANTFLCIFIHSQSQGEDAELRDSTDNSSFTQLDLLAKYICELTLLQGETFLQFLPSEMAASSLYVAADTLNLNEWRKSVFRKSGHSVESLEKPIKYIHKFLTVAPRLQWPAIRDYYSSDENSNVAKIRPKPDIVVTAQNYN